jgi:hypothetical protein
MDLLAVKPKPRGERGNGYAVEANLFPINIAQLRLIGVTDGVGRQGGDNLDSPTPRASDEHLRTRGGGCIRRRLPSVSRRAVSEMLSLIWSRKRMPKAMSGQQRHTTRRVHTIVAQSKRAGVKGKLDRSPVEFEHPDCLKKVLFRTMLQDVSSDILIICLRSSPAAEVVITNTRARRGIFKSSKISSGSLNAVMSFDNGIGDLQLPE